MPIANRRLAHVQSLEKWLDNLPAARLWVVGCPGSGKTTVSKRLAEACRLEYVPLDDYYWGPRWHPIPMPALEASVGRATKGQRWVVDGSYVQLEPLMRDRASAIIWVREPFGRCLRRVLSRSLQRITSGDPVCNGNRETPWTFLKPDGMLHYATLRYPSNMTHCSRLVDGFIGPAAICDSNLKMQDGTRHTDNI